MHSALYIFVVVMLAVLTASAPEPPKDFRAPSDAFAHIEYGQTVAVQNGFSISFFDENSALRRLELRSSCVIRPGKCSFSNRFIFMPDIGFGIVYKNGRWQPAGGAVFDRSGKAVREFSAAKSAFAENNSVNDGYFRAGAVFFIDENTVAIKTQQGTFLYNIVRDTTVLKNCGGRRHEHAPHEKNGEPIENKHEDFSDEHGRHKNEHHEHDRPNGGLGKGSLRPIVEHGKPPCGKHI